MAKPGSIEPCSFVRPISLRKFTSLLGTLAVTGSRDTAMSTASEPGGKVTVTSERPEASEPAMVCEVLVSARDSPVVTPLRVVVSTTRSADDDSSRVSPCVHAT